MTQTLPVLFGQAKATQVGRVSTWLIRAQHQRGAEFDACDCIVDLVVDWLTITTLKRWQTTRKYKTICRRGHRPPGERLVENLCSTVIVIEISTSDLLRVGPKFTRPACRATTAAIDRYLLPAPDLCSKPADRRCCCRLMGQTDRRTDGRTVLWRFPRRLGVVVSGVRRMNEVDARRARLVPGWVTVFGRVYHLGM